MDARDDLFTAAAYDRRRTRHGVGRTARQLAVRYVDGRLPGSMRRRVADANTVDKMMVRIDHDACEGHQLCVVFAPEVFASDDEGYAVLVTGGLEGEVPAGLEDQAEAALLSCPEGAIHIE